MINLQNGKVSSRLILHIDADAFFALQIYKNTKAVEKLLDLKNF